MEVLPEQPINSLSQALRSLCPGIMPPVPAWRQKIPSLIIVPELPPCPYIKKKGGEIEGIILAPPSVISISLGEEEEMFDVGK
jgi:hypothetical protein